MFRGYGGLLSSIGGLRETRLGDWGLTSDIVQAACPFIMVDGASVRDSSLGVGLDFVGADNEQTMNWALSSLKSNLKTVK